MPKGLQGKRHVRVDVLEYQFVWMCRPKGKRDWWFTIGEDIFIFADMVYSIAYQAAIQEALDRGSLIVYLLP